MGTRAADSIFQQILSEQYGIPTDLKEWPKYPPMIGLAVGKKAVVYDPEGGAKCSEEAMKIYFGEDLAFQRKYKSFSYVHLRGLELTLRRMLGLSEA